MTCTPGRICCWPPSECPGLVVLIPDSQPAEPPRLGGGGGSGSADFLGGAGKQLSGGKPVDGWLGNPPPSAPLRTHPSALIMDFVFVCFLYFLVSERDGFINPNPGFLQFTSPTLGMAGRPFPVGSLFQLFPASLDAYFSVGSTSPCLIHTATRARSGCLYVTHVHPSLPAALITLFPTLLFGIFHRRKIYYNSRGENSKSLAKFRSRAHLNFYSGFSIYLIYSCLWLRCHIAGVLWPAQACSGRRCVRPHVSLAGAAQTAALIYLVLEDAVCSVDSVI